MKIERKRLSDVIRTIKKNKKIYLYFLSYSLIKSNIWWIRKHDYLQRATGGFNIISRLYFILEFFFLFVLLSLLSTFSLALKLKQLKLYRKLVWWTHFVCNFKSYVYFFFSKMFYIYIFFNLSSKDTIRADVRIIWLIW